MDKRELGGPEQVRNLLGLARRAGVLLVGQDNVFDAFRTGEKLLVLTTNDAVPNVLRHVKSAEERGSAVHIVLEDVDRSTLGAQIGVTSAQIVAIPSNNGLAAKILKILRTGSDAHE